MRNAQKTAAESNALYYKIEIILALIFMCGAFTPLIYILVSVYVTKASNISQTGIIVACIVTIGFGCIMFHDGMKRNMLYRMFRKYTGRLTSDPERSIVALAKSVKVDGKTVRNNIEYLISRGWYANAKVDLKNKRMIFANEVKAPVKPKEDCFDASLPIVTCKRCKGQNYDPKGDLSICYYCGSKIKK